MYFLTTVSSYSDGTVAEVTKQLSAAQHESIERERADVARPKVVQRRVSFLWERQAFELHTDLEPAYGINVLHRRSEVCICVYAWTACVRVYFLWPCACVCVYCFFSLGAFGVHTLHCV